MPLVSIYSKETIAKNLLLIWRCAFGVFLFLKIADCQSPQSPPKGSILWQVQEAKKNNKTKIELAQPLTLWGEPGTLENTVARCSLVMAEFIGSATVYDSTQIITWNKFRLVEILHKQNRELNEELPADIPANLSPIQDDEFLLPTFNGSVTIDGVKVSQTDPEVQNFKTGLSHLMYLTFRSHSLATPTYGPKGLFWVDINNEIKPLFESASNQIAKEMNTRNIVTINAIKTLVSKPVQ